MANALEQFKQLKPTHEMFDSCRNCGALQEGHENASISPRALFRRALSLLGPPPTSSMLPLTISWRSKKALRGATEIASVAGLVAYVVPNSGSSPDYIYTDGSRIGSPPASGASAVLQDGHIVLCCVPGNQNSYNAEVVGILLGSHFSPPHATLRLDSKGAVAATTRIEAGPSSQTIPPVQKPISEVD